MGQSCRSQAAGSQRPGEAAGYQRSPDKDLVLIVYLKPEAMKQTHDSLSTKNFAGEAVGQKGVTPLLQRFLFCFVFRRDYKGRGQIRRGT